MNIEQLRYFQLTASFQHMSKAADMLNISQPALGSNIRRLEIELGVPLFDRVGRNIVLNSYGEEFLKSANSIIDIWSEATIKLKSYSVSFSVWAAASIFNLFFYRAFRTFEHEDSSH